MGTEPDRWYVKGSDGRVYGPADLATLAVWASEGRVEPTGCVSRDRKTWTLAPKIPELGMDWIVETEPRKWFGPFNRKVVSRLAATGSIPPGAVLYRRHPLAVDKDPEPQVVEKVVEKVGEKQGPVEKIVEKVVIKEVPVEKIVEKIVEVEVTPPPPAPPKKGLFKDVDPARLAALEAAAQRELAAARGFRLNGTGLFSRRRP